MIVIQARTGSTRLPGKVLADVGGVPLLHLLVERLRTTRLGGPILVATTDLPADDAVAELALARGARVYRGHATDVLARFQDAARAEAADVIVRISADSPFLDGDTVDDARWLPGILSGRDTWCIGMSEPDAGSDVASLRTTAVATDDGFVVNGRKVWTSGAAHADWCYLIARTDPDAPRHAGLSDLVVDMRAPGIEVRPIIDMTANGHFCEVTFDEVQVPGDHLVGEPNGSLQAGDAADGARARRDRPPAQQPPAVRVVPPAGRHVGSARPPGGGPPRDGVPDRPPPRAPGGAGSGTEAVLRGDQDVLHRARAARRRRSARRPSAPPPSSPSPGCRRGCRAASATRRPTR